MKNITYASSALRMLGRMPRNTAVLIQNKIEQYASDPRSLANNVKRLKGTEVCRLRVADWRILFVEDATRLDIRRIAPRGAAYE